MIITKAGSRVTEVPKEESPGRLQSVAHSCDVIFHSPHVCGPFTYGETVCRGRRRGDLLAAGTPGGSVALHRLIAVLGAIQGRSRTLVHTEHWLHEKPQGDLVGMGGKALHHDAAIMCTTFGRP